MIDRIVNPETPDEDEVVEEQAHDTLRPNTFDTYIGQTLIKQNLKMAIDAAKVREEPVEHVLLYGPPGLGKTTMAGVIAHELGSNFRITSGPAIERPGDLASLLTNLSDGDILFIDEIHRLPKTVE
jgi:Holliday junction DNA helicase RuvB